MFLTPVLFLVFNRPETTRIVFSKIKKVKPKYLFIAADGPRKDEPSDIEKCIEVRNIVNEIDWDCELRTLFRDENLGCGLAPSTAMSWFFDHVEQGIILEDDCLPDISFFSYCETLLNYYRDNDKVMHISGNSYRTKIKRESYYFSKYIHPPHGWATWRRAWRFYDYKMEKLIEFQKSNGFEEIFFNEEEKEFWMTCFYKTYNLQHKDLWSDQWLFALWVNKGLAIRPYINLVENIGYGDGATHTKDVTSNTNNNKAFSLTKISHPKNVKIDSTEDKYLYKKIYNPKVIFYVRWKIFGLSVIKNVLTKLLIFSSIKGIQK